MRRPSRCAGHEWDRRGGWDHGKGDKHSEVLTVSGRGRTTLVLWLRWESFNDLA